MRKKILLISIFLFLLAMIPMVLQNYNTKKENQVCFKDYCFYVELAITPEERSNGLMFREELGLEKGMLFVFEEEGKHSFWMKNTLIPLDIIWINKNKEIVFIGENTQPCKELSCPSVKPTKNAKYVLEINGGIAKKIGLVAGDKINFSIK